MQSTNPRIYISKSENYFNVYLLRYVFSDKKSFMAKIQINGKKKSKHFKTEREAALFVDKSLIDLGKEPINILKRA